MTERPDCARSEAMMTAQAGNEGAHYLVGVLLALATPRQLQRVVVICDSRDDAWHVRARLYIQEELTRRRTGR